MRVPYPDDQWSIRPPRVRNAKETEAHQVMLVQVRSCELCREGLVFELFSALFAQP